MHSLYASSGPKAEWVPNNNQRGRGSEPCRLRGGLSITGILLVKHAPVIVCGRKLSRDNLKISPREGPGS